MSIVLFDFMLFMLVLCRDDHFLLINGAKKGDEMNDKCAAIVRQSVEYDEIKIKLSY